VFQKLVSHNDDLGRLVKKGYAVAFDSCHLIVRDIPYLDNNGQLQWGAIVTKLEFVDNERITQDDHQIFFCGSIPYGKDRAPIPNLAGGPAICMLSNSCRDILVQRRFSNKPTKSGKFADFYEKIESYVSIISGPAMEDHNVNPYSFRVVTDVPTDSVFKFHDTLTSRAEIGELSASFKNDVVAIIGLGGTGGYLLDFLVKTPVREIRAFDLDPFHVHNAFRSPGRLTLDELGKTKAAVYHGRYENFRHGLKIAPKFFDFNSSEELADVTFAFVCVDKGSSRAGIFDVLLNRKIPFIDVGMGLHRKRGPINGMLRATYYSADHGNDTRDKGLAPLSDSEDDIYMDNIQIGELNALNACLAIIKFKQLRQFYYEDTPSSCHKLFEVGDMKITSEI
jgi:hypothetical protein